MVEAVNTTAIAMNARLGIELMAERLLFKLRTSPKTS
jgi:hypothetical protein